MLELEKVLHAVDEPEARLPDHFDIRLSGPSRFVE